jgi:hypothetical protein
MRRSYPIAASARDLINAWNTRSGGAPISISLMTASLSAEILLMAIVLSSMPEGIRGYIFR